MKAAGIAAGIAVAIGVMAAAQLAWNAISRAPVDMLSISATPLAHADVVAIHGGGGSDPSRERAAVRLWREGRAAHIVALGGPLPHGDPDVTYAQTVARRVAELGVPSESVTRVNAGGSTADEVVALRRRAETEGWRRVILTSSRWHTRRVALAASQAFAQSGIEWSVVGGDDLGFDAERWWDDPQTRQLVLGEWAKIGLGLLFPAPGD